MKNSVVWLIVIMGCGVSAALIASCEKSSGSPYVPEVQKDDEPSGIGYARKLFPGKGDVLFTVSRQSSGTETLAIRACGKAEADINVNGQHYSAVFQKGGSTWEVVAVSVQLKAGENTIIVSRKDGGVTGMWVDYIEFQ